MYSQRFNGIVDVHPRGPSFTHASAPGGGFRGGSYNNAGRGFAGSQAVGRGFAESGRAGQAAPGRAAQPGTSYGGFGQSRGFAQPVQRAPQQSFAGRSQGFSGGSAPHYSAPAAPHYSAPSGGGFHGGGGGGSHFSGGGGGSHGGGGHR